MDIQKEELPTNKFQEFDFSLFDSNEEEVPGLFNLQLIILQENLA